MIITQVEHPDMFDKLKEIVEQQKTFEEEDLQYNYKGSDKEQIWACMEFFYQNIWVKNFRPFVYSDKDDWENYHFQLEYNGKFSEVEIVYGIGAFCVIHPMNHKPTNASKVLDLNNITVNGEEVHYDE